MAAAAADLPLITVLGSLNIDLVSYVPHHPAPGETLTASSFALSPGGKGANQAVACAKLSRSRSRGGRSPAARVAMLGAVGPDSYGERLRANLEAHGVDVSGVRTVGEGEEEDGGGSGAAAAAATTTTTTGIATIIVDEPSGQNRIVLSPGANHAVGAREVAAAVGPGGSGNRPDLLVMQLEIPLGVVEAAARSARARGVPVLLNPAPAVAALGDDVLAGLAHLVVNETEAAVLAGCEVGELDARAGLERVGEMFVGKGVRNVIITLGGRGVYYANSDGARGLLDAEKAAVVDTTAAGDTFVGQYAVEVVTTPVGSKFDIAAAVRKANRAAARTVERKGAQDSIPWRDELLDER